MLTDYYKHMRSAEEIEQCLTACGLVNLEVYYGGNGVEARARAIEPAKVTASQQPNHVRLS
jgi:hypothetical protein